MKITFLKRIFRFVIAKPTITVVIVFCIIAAGAVAGTLSPSASPAATMHTLSEIYNAVADTFDSSGISADQNGSLMGMLKYIDANVSDLAVSSNSLDFDEIVNSATLDANFSVASATYATTWNGNFYHMQGNVGIASSSPSSLLSIQGGNITHVASTDPVQVGYRLLAGGNGGNSFGISDNIAYVANGTNVEAIDISNPASPSLITTITTAGSALGTYIVGKLLYVADTNALRIYDIAVKTNPVALGSISTTSARYVIVHGKYAYVSDYGAGRFYIIDVSNPAFLTIVYTSGYLSSSPYEMSISGNFLYAARNNFGFQIYDISNPKVPVYYTTIDPGNIRTVRAIGRYLYAGGSSGLYIYDITNPTSPSLISTIAEDTWKLVPSGRYLYATTYTSTAGLTTYDVSDPTAPREVGHFSDDDPAVFEVDGRYAYLSGFGGDFHVIDLNGTFTPTLTTGSLQAGLLHVLGETTIGSSLTVRTGLNVGSQGLLVSGEGAFDVRSSASALTITQRGRGNLFSLNSSASQVFYIQASSSGNVNLTFKSPWASGNDGKFTIRSSGVNDRLDIINSANANLMTIASTGYVGIGTTAPADALHVIGDIRTSACASDGAGDVACVDVAETYQTSEILAAGDVVSVDPAFVPIGSQSFAIKKATSGSSLVGVVSTHPAILIEGTQARFGGPKVAGTYQMGDKAPIALAGRVPVKVSTENGNISPGDRLTASSTNPGIAVKATNPGMTIGIALEPYTGSGPNTILIFVSLSYWAGSVEVPQVTSNGFVAQPLHLAFMDALARAFDIVIEKGVLRVANLISDILTTKKLCIEDVCVNRDQLKVLLERNGIPVMLPSVVTSPLSEPTPTVNEEPSITPEPTEEPEPSVFPSPSETVESTPDGSMSLPLPSVALTPSPSATPELTTPKLTPSTSETPTPKPTLEL